jgi:hypothetical protein
MYVNDSIHTLTTTQQIGLGFISLALLCMMVFVSLKLFTNKPFIVRFIIAIGLFYLFIWLSPQLYYAYYLLIFTDLPIQLVIKAPSSIGQLIKIFTLQSSATLSNHSLAFLGWVLISLALMKRWK